MCFVNDCDWYAQVCEQTSGTAEKPVRCDECHRMIAVGQPVHHVFMQQHEMCQRCEDGECECPAQNPEDYHECSCPEPNFGETFDYDCCDDCHKFLQAVEHAEVEAGCSRYEARPNLCEMTEAISNGGKEDARRYWKVAAKRYPELVASGYLGWLWRKVFYLGRQEAQQS